MKKRILDAIACFSFASVVANTVGVAAALLCDRPGVGLFFLFAIQGSFLLMICCMACAQASPQGKG
jgi:hypothetical protein